MVVPLVAMLPHCCYGNMLVRNFRIFQYFRAFFFHDDTTISESTWFFALCFSRRWWICWTRSRRPSTVIIATTPSGQTVPPRVPMATIRGRRPIPAVTRSGRSRTIRGRLRPCRPSGSIHGAARPSAPALQRHVSARINRINGQSAGGACGRHGDHRA